jgi:PTS system mannose-specific IIB component
VIVLLRVDNRLIHGQILEAWVPSLRADRIVVADDEAARSPLATAAMRLAVPPELPVEILPSAEVDWAGLAKANEAILVLFRDIGDLDRARAHGLSPAICRRVNLGNIHFGASRRAATGSVFLSDDEMNLLKSLAAEGFEVAAQSIPSESPTGPEALGAKLDASRPANP